MVFSSITFLFYFLPCFMLSYAVLPGANIVLLAGSLLFYAWGDLLRVPILLTCIALNWTCGLAIAKGRKATLVTGIIGNLALLFWFKYAAFGAAQASVLASWLGLPPVPIPEITLPLGISFFTFQGISYLVDIHRGVVRAQPSLLKFAMYKSMFPPLIAGPIVRYAVVADRVDRRNVTAAAMASGIETFIIGLAQKVLLANTLAVPVDRIFALPAAQLSPQLAWLGAFGYALQIYYDFAGYSNMAIGLGRMLGFELPINFNRPYASQSVSEFWRRWHITLSTWFRDYLYIPLGGNRRGNLRTYCNLLVVFLLCGLWHGASWNFAVWGLYHGAFLTAERMGFDRLLARLPGIVRHAYLVVVVIASWVPFRAESLGHAAMMWRAMIGATDAVALPADSITMASGWVALAAGAVGDYWCPAGRLHRAAVVLRCEPCRGDLQSVHLLPILMETITAARSVTFWRRLRTRLWRIGWFIPTFCALLALPGLVQLVSRAPTDMGAENRRAAPPPEWPDTRAAFIGIPAATDAWLSDVFGFRNDLVWLNTFLRWRMLGEVSAKLIVVGRHGRLFLGSHNGAPPQSLITVVCGSDATETVVAQAAAEMRHTLDIARSVGLQPTLLIVPTAARLYPEDLPSQLAAPCAGHTPLGDAVAARLSGEPVIYPLAEMLRLKQETEVIPRHRFHWAGLAPLRIAELIAEVHWGLPRTLHLPTMRKTRESDLNSLSPGLELTDTIDEPQFIAAGVNECWLSQCQLDGVPAASLQAESAYSRPGDGKLLIISDSFGDEIGPDFVEQFGDVWMVSINFTRLMTVADRKVLAAALLRKFRNGRVLFVIHDFGTVVAFDRSVAEVLTP